MSEKHIYILIRKFFSSSLPENIQIVFRKWILQDNHTNQKREVMQELWEETAGVADQSTHKDLQRLHIRMGVKESAKNRFYTRSLKIAAILLLPLIGGLTSYLLFNKEIRYIEPQWVEYFVKNGEIRELLLPDSTHVWLNSGSILIYAAGFEGEKRQLYLNGEAIFDVAKDPNKPFIVKTNHMEIEALGTLFNVEAYSDTDLSIATLEEGKIKIKIPGYEENPFYLSPDQQVSYNFNSGETTREEVDAARVMQWKDGFLLFESVSFDYIIRSLERRFDVTIQYETSLFAGRSYRMTFRPNEGLPKILEIMKEMTGMDYHTHDNIIYINLKK